MARKTASPNASKTKQPSKDKARASRGAGNRKEPARGRVAVRDKERSRFLDDHARQDIMGVSFAIVAVILLVAAVLPTDAVITSLLSTVLHLVFGLGAYFLPFLLLVIGACFLVRFDRERVPARVTVGLAMIFFAILVMVALFTPLSNPHDLSLLFEHDTLVARGGYIGAGVAWAGLTLFGQVISCIIMVGVVLAGLAIIGLSLSRLIERLRERHGQRSEEGESRSSNMLPLARIKRGKAADGEELATNDLQQNPIKPAHPLVDAASTNVLPHARERKRPRRASAPLSASPDVAVGEAGEGAVAFAPIPSFEGEAAPMTRKLGRKKMSEEDKSKQSEGGGSKGPKAKTSKKLAKNDGDCAVGEARGDFMLPSLSLLKVNESAAKDNATESELQETAQCLQETLESFNIFAEVVGWVAGPTVTLFKVDLPAGVRVNRITALEQDIALALAAPGVRIFAPIPGTNYVGIEVPNRTRQSVLLGDVLKDAPAGPLQIAVGKDVEGRCIVSDLAKMPHLLIGGTTGSGKSVSINAMIMSILMRATPDEVRFIMIDPKRVEFTPYNGIPHLYVPVVTEAKEAASALSWGVAEMERRLKVFSKVGARNIGQFNAKVLAEKEAVRTAEEAGNEPPEATLGDELPYIVIIIDELADLMMNVGKEVEFSISRIAQLARAAGIHLIVATQRPSTNVVTGLIKANITNRIAFNVASGIDSRVVLDTPGAERLIGLGDLLFSKPEYAKPQRIQGCYVSEDEINAVVSMWKEQGEPEYHSEILQTNLITLGASSPDGSGGGSTSDDPLIWEAADIVVSTGLGSTSNIQRRLKVGYSRAGRIMDMLEEKGVVGPPNGSKPREVLVDAMELETLKAFEVHDAAQDASYMEE